MTQTYLQVQKQIQALQREAEKLRVREMSGVIERIKVATAEYGITAEQLGFGSTSKPVVVKKTPGKSQGAKQSQVCQWTGTSLGSHGPAPFMVARGVGNRQVA